LKKSSRYLEILTKEFSRLPGIGPKSASRLAFHILKKPLTEVENFAQALLEVKQNITTCKICNGISDEDICLICQDDNRNKSLICVVEEAKDILTINSTGEFQGVFHVLGGVISPLDGIGPEDLNINSLINRINNNQIEEIILALNPNIEGDATSLYLGKILGPLEVKITRIAHGLPVGTDLEFADSATIIKSLEGRQEI